LNKKAESAKGFRDRVYGYADKIKQKKEMIKEEALDQQMKECTFTPAVINPVEKPRNLDEFLQDQSKFVQRKLDNIAKISEDGKEKVKESISKMPTIDPTSAEMASKLPRDKPIHERLYLSSKKTIKEEEKKEEKPKKKIPKEERRDLKLYQLAVEKNEEKFKKMAEEAKQKKPKSEKKPPIEDPLVVQGFRKEFLSVISNFGLNEGSKSSYEQMKLILANMYFIKENMEENPEDEISNLLKKLWGSLKPADEDLIPVNLLESCLAGILNIKMIKVELKPEEIKGETKEIAPPQPESKNEFEPPIFNNEDIARLTKEFDLLRIHRKSNKPQRKKIIEKIDYEFKPSLCEESVKMAENAREKILSLQGNTQKSEGSDKKRDLAVLADAMANKKRAQEEYFLIKNPQNIGNIQ